MLKITCYINSDAEFTELKKDHFHFDGDIISVENNTVRYELCAGQDGLTLYTCERAPHGEFYTTDETLADDFTENIHGLEQLVSEMIKLIL